MIKVTTIAAVDVVKAALSMLPAARIEVCSDLPMYALRAGDYRLVCSANQNNDRHFGESKTWAGIPSQKHANAIASALNALPTLLMYIDELRKVERKYRELLEREPMPMTSDEFVEPSEVDAGLLVALRASITPKGRK